MPRILDREQSYRILCEKWYRDPFVREFIYRGMGVEGDIDRDRLVNDIEYSKQQSMWLKPWTIGITGYNIYPIHEYRESNFRSDGLFYAYPKELLPDFLNDTQHIRGIHASHIRNDGIDFYLDVDRYTNDKRLLIVDQARLFAELDPFYRMIRGKLHDFDIEHRAMITCKGINILGSVHEDSDVYKRLVNIAGPINQLLVNRDEHVPENKERAYKAMTRLQQYFFLTLIASAQRFYTENQGRFGRFVRVEISDRFKYAGGGIACDMTNRRKRANEPFREIEGSICDKNACYADDIGHDAFNRTPIPIKIPIGERMNGENRFFFNSLSDAVGFRNDPWAAFDVVKHNAEHSLGGRIPNCENGMNNLINAYLNSKLYHCLHKPIDEITYFPVNEWHDPGKAYLIPQWSESLLNPDTLDVVIYNVFKNVGGDFSSNDYNRNKNALKETIGFLASRYRSDPEFKLYFEHHDPVTCSVGWVELILGQHFIRRI
ncbi:MAG: hypothetical protein HZB65_04455 [Candidatus Aenigmarchaeota archaeon]|nr:hypothetical protein [Candidatus Aenigmarchaeota archaeon]